MSVDRLPSGTFRARVTINGARQSATFATRQEAEEWEIVTRAQAIAGSLPSSITVGTYAARWLLGYQTAPRNTRVFHETNSKHITAALGPFAIAKVTPSDITSMLNGIVATRTPALAERVYRTASAMFGSAAADGLCPSGSPVRSKRHRPRRQRSEQPSVRNAGVRPLGGGARPATCRGRDDSGVGRRCRAGRDAHRPRFATARGSPPRYGLGTDCDPGRGR
jgi:hypothetical protein